MRKNPEINESFICRIWDEHKEFCDELKTDDGSAVKVIDPGIKNFDGGPDYLNTVIQIGDKKFRGDVEIHKDYNSWSQHKHYNDKKYNSVILQVVLWNKGINKPQLHTHRDIPTVILSEHLKFSIHDVWLEIIKKPSLGYHLNCHQQHGIIDETINRMIIKCGMERIQMKTRRMHERLIEISRYSEKQIDNPEVWEQLLYEFIFEALGYSKNKEPFTELAKNLNIFKAKVILNEFDNFDAMHAALYGFSGLLAISNDNDEYKTRIEKLYLKIKGLIRCGVLSGSEWQFFRLRPQNFPTVRLAYGSQLLYKLIRQDLLNKLIHLFREDISELKLYNNIILLLKPEKDKYWNKHYNFGKETKREFKLLGNDRINEIIINNIIPFIKLYSEIFNENRAKENSQMLYESLRINANNHIIRLMNKELPNSTKVNTDYPIMSQGLIQLYTFYCMRNRCSGCLIGKNTFKENGYDYKIIYY